jgi:hypothetical protein
MPRETWTYPKEARINIFSVEQLKIAGEKETYINMCLLDLRSINKKERFN